MKYFKIITCILSSYLSFSQNNFNEDTDEMYREDQFYASITYNLLQNRPNDIEQTGFSSGFHLGFIRDMPFNKKRNLALGLGLGLSSNSYNQNIRITETNTGLDYSFTGGDGVEILKNKFTTYLLEAPFELRWRTSKSDDYRFWRIYAGFKLSYLLYNSSKYKTVEEKDRISNNDDFNSLQYGLTLSAGYGTWNFQLYYGLNPIFETSAKLNGSNIGMRAVKIGLIFYIL